jgi:hypothetical protein
VERRSRQPHGRDGQRDDGECIGDGHSPIMAPGAAGSAVAVLRGNSRRW